MKRSVNASTIGRRNPQQILKDFLRPEPSSTISSPSITTGGGYGGGIPGCAVGQPDPDSSACVDDYFNDVTSPGSGWGIADTGQQWEVSGGNGTTAVTVDGNGRLLFVGSGSGTAQVAATSYMAPTCAAEGVDAEILAHFRIGGTGWTSTRPFSVANGSASAYNSPATRIDPDQPDDNLEAGVAQHYLQIQTGGAAFGSYVRIFNSLGQLWVATKFGNSLYQNLPQAIGATVDEFWVRLWITSAGNLYGKVWGGALEDQPSGWILDEPNREWNGEPRVIAVFKTNVAGWVSYSVNCTEFHINTTLTANRSGLFSGALFRENNYWRTSSTEVNYINKVWFDGVQAQNGVNYTIQDNYKVVPTDYSLLNDTRVTAEYVIM